MNGKYLSNQYKANIVKNFDSISFSSMPINSNVFNDYTCNESQSLQLFSKNVRIFRLQNPRRFSFHVPIDYYHFNCSLTSINYVYLTYLQSFMWNYILNDLQRKIGFSQRFVAIVSINEKIRTNENKTTEDNEFFSIIKKHLMAV